MKRILSIVIFAALVGATGCARKTQPAGPATGDGIPVEMNSSDNAAAL